MKQSNAGPGIPLRYGLLALVVALLLIPHGATWAIASMILVLPVAITGVRGRNHPFFCWAAYVVSFVVFVFIRDVADAVGFGPFVQYPIVLDKVLGFGVVDPTFALQRLYAPGAAEWWDHAALVVYLTHFVSIPIAGLFVWRFRQESLQPFLLGMALLYLLAAIVHVLLPTAPPWVASQMGYIPRVYRPVADLLGGYSPGMYEYGLSIAGGNDVAAMPSVHVAAATMIARVSWGSPIGMLGVGYAVAMGLSLVYLGEHYFVDLLVGAGLALWCWRRAASVELTITR